VTNGATRFQIPRVITQPHGRVTDLFIARDWGMNQVDKYTGTVWLKQVSVRV
jgi:hypothetical protein